MADVDVRRYMDRSALHGLSEYNLLSRGHYVEPNTHTSVFLGNTFNLE
jgi:hypothetical protein